MFAGLRASPICGRRWHSLESAARLKANLHSRIAGRPPQGAESAPNPARRKHSRLRTQSGTGDNFGIAGSDRWACDVTWKIWVYRQMRLKQSIFAEALTRSRTIARLFFVIAVRRQPLNAEHPSDAFLKGRFVRATPSASLQHSARQLQCSRMNNPEARQRTSVQRPDAIFEPRRRA
jgi:hypothetical protein